MSVVADTPSADTRLVSSGSKVRAGRATKKKCSAPLGICEHQVTDLDVDTQLLSGGAGRRLAGHLSCADRGARRDVADRAGSDFP